MQLAELLHRHVLLRPGEGAGDRLVEGVREDLLGLLRRRVGHDDLVEGPLHVEHHRVERPAGRGVDVLDGPGGVVQLGQAHRLGQPAGRVDGEDDDPAALLGGPEAEGRGRGRLADAAGTTADDDVGTPVGQQRVDVQARSRGAWPGCSPRVPRRRPSRARASRSANSRTVDASTPSGFTGRRNIGRSRCSSIPSCSVSWATRSAWSWASASSPCTSAFGRPAARPPRGRRAPWGG